MADNSKKRKNTSNPAPAQKRPRFPGKPAHQIKALPTTTLYPNGELNVSRFMRAHELEIKSLEKAMKAAKKGLSRRAFQDVPREMRRRTGSHNPQRVPKRLRMKAVEEARIDNTPTSKNKSGSGIGKGAKKWLRMEGRDKSRRAGVRKQKAKGKEEKVTVTAVDVSGGEMGQSKLPIRRASVLKNDSTMKDGKPKRIKQIKPAKPPMPPSRFRRRQVHKTWLPTHVWHAKRATMTPPKEPLWRFALPLAPVSKCYRLTHRAATLRGAVAWDMSYMATISLEGVEASMTGLLKGLHFAKEDGNKPWQEKGLGKKWRDGTRVWEGWIYEREGNIPRKIAQVAVVWSVTDTSESNKRKAFIRVHPSAFLHLWNEVTKIAKVQKPAVTVEDLRFEMGSIEIVGPAAAETLCSILVPNPSVAPASDTVESIWKTLASVTDSGILPPNAVMAFPCADPRLRDPPKSAHNQQDSNSQSDLLETLAYWPVDRTQSTAGIFNCNTRLAAGRSLSSQQSINKRKSAAMPGQYPEPRSTDPQIPVLIYVSRHSKRWTVLLPWKCVLPVWRGITRYPVSTGGNPRFGGLNQIRQVNYERSEPCFPFDCPGTDAGWVWELEERVQRKTEWTKRPKGKRIEWKSIDLGNDKKGEVGDPWSCDWERLLPPMNEEDRKALKKSETSSPFRQIASQEVPDLIAGRSSRKEYLSVPHVFAAKISMVQRGVPTNCARIYRLPSNNAELRSQWLALMPGSKSTAAKKREPSRRNDSSKNKSLPKHLQTRALARSLLEPMQAGDSDYPCVPNEEDLIGFVTTGNYNLAEGMPTAVANLVLHRVLQSQDAGYCGTEVGKRPHICIVREAGQTVGRLATWEPV